MRLKTYGIIIWTLAVIVLLNEMLNVRLGNAINVTSSDIFNLRVVQQPAHDPWFVSGFADTVTQFSMAQLAGTTGFLAHNDLAGKYFSSLNIGDSILVEYSNHDFRKYEVLSISQYEVTRIGANDVYQNIYTGDQYSTEQIFQLMYTGAHHVILQTCIKKEDDADWGRLFIYAIPK